MFGDSVPHGSSRRLGLFIIGGHSPFEQGEASADFGKTTAMLKCSIFFGQAFPWHWYLWYFGGPQKHSAGVRGIFCLATPYD